MVADSIKKDVVLGYSQRVVFDDGVQTDFRHDQLGYTWNRDELLRRLILRLPLQ